MSKPLYVILTAAQNEGRFIANTIESVLGQSIVPLKWLIISDGSTDDTDDIVQRYAKHHDFLTLVRRPRNRLPGFGSKAIAVNEAYSSLGHLPHAYVAILDSDVTLPPTYYEEVFGRFEQDELLGVAGGVLCEILDGKRVMAKTSVDWSVSGAVQTFRRACFEGIEGYRPVRKSIDGVADCMARMKGWRVRSFLEINAVHHRQMGTRNETVARARFLNGVGYYAVGYHPLYMVVRCGARLGERPVFTGSLLELWGYLSQALLRRPKDVPESYVRYARDEQLSRVFKTFGLLSLSRKLSPGLSPTDTP